MLNTNEKIIKHKVGLLNLAEELGNVSKACKIMGLSRDTFYRYQEAVEEGGIEALFEQARRKPNTKNRVDEQTEAAVLAYALDFPLQEFYQVTFRKKVYTDIDALQKDLDEWLHYYNIERTHQGKMC